MIFWSLHAHDVNLFAFGNRASIHRCPRCHEIIDKWSIMHDDLNIPNTNADIAMTYDGLYLAGPRFRHIYEENSIQGIDFFPTANTEWKWIKARRRLKFDAEKRGTRFFDRCEVCGKFKQVIGAKPVYITEEIADRDIVWSDLEFGNADEKHPLLLCGEEAGAIMQEENLRGIIIRKYTSSM